MEAALIVLFATSLLMIAYGLYAFTRQRQKATENKVRAHEAERINFESALKRDIDNTPLPELVEQRKKLRNIPK